MLQIFNFQSKTQVRTVTKDDEVWFVATDIAQILGYRDAEKMVRMLDDDEADTHKVGIRSENGVEQIREVLVISESGLYSAVIKSQRDEAKPFRRWVTHEVLPGIRKKGFYETPEYVAMQLEARKVFALEDKVERQQAEIASLCSEIASCAPINKAERYDIAYKATNKGMRELTEHWRKRARKEVVPAIKAMRTWLKGMGYAGDITMSNSLDKIESSMFLILNNQDQD